MRTFIIGMLLSLSAPIFAGSESHGGVGVRDGAKLYVLDLYEAGLEESAYVNKFMKPARGLPYSNAGYFDIYILRQSAYFHGFPCRRISREIFTVNSINSGKVIKIFHEDAFLPHSGNERL